MSPVVTPTLTAKDILEQTLLHLVTPNTWVKGDWLSHENYGENAPKQWKACSMGAMLLVEHINAFGSDEVKIENWTETIRAYSDRDPEFQTALLALANTIAELQPERGGVEDIFDEIRFDNEHNGANEPVEIGIWNASDVVINFNDHEDTTINDIREVFTEAQKKV